MDMLFLLNLLPHMLNKMGISTQINDLRNTIPAGVKIIAVSKTKPVEAINEAYLAGQRCFGENKVQELLAKKPLLPNDTEWHLIGHLQTNKVKSIVAHAGLIHSVDSQKLLAEINKESAKQNIITRCLLQFHIATEETKFGLSYSEAENIINTKEFSEYKNIMLCGVMGMATFTDDTQLIRDEFRQLYKYFDDLKKTYFLQTLAFKEISMGMSSDYAIAIDEGSTMIRVGSIIFGGR